jgi:hypothetical protein
MKKPKSKARRMSDLKRAAKRSARLKESRKTLTNRKLVVIRMRAEEKKKYLEFIKKLQEARTKGEF